MICLQEIIRLLEKERPHKTLWLTGMGLSGFWFENRLPLGIELWANWDLNAGLTIPGEMCTIFRGSSQLFTLSPWTTVTPVLSPKTPGACGSRESSDQSPCLLSADSFYLKDEDEDSEDSEDDEEWDTSSTSSDSDSEEEEGKQTVLASKFLKK